MISFKFIRFNFCCLSIKLTVSGICEYVGRVLSYVSNLTIEFVDRQKNEIHKNWCQANINKTKVYCLFGVICDNYKHV